MPYARRFNIEYTDASVEDIIIGTTLGLSENNRIAVGSEKKIRRTQLVGVVGCLELPLGVGVHKKNSSSYSPLLQMLLISDSA